MFPTHDLAAACLKPSLLSQVNLDGDGGFIFSPGKGRRVLPLRPASVRSLWTAVQSIFKIKEGADSQETADWSWLDHYRKQIEDPNYEVG